MRLIGYIDGVEVSFSFYPPNEFKATIPKSINGRYIMQLTAIDEAGNQTSSSDIYVYIDFKSLDFVVLDENYKELVEEEDWNSVEVDEKFIEEIKDTDFKTNAIKSDYSYRELVVM